MSNFEFVIPALEKSLYTLSTEGGPNSEDNFFGCHGKYPCIFRECVSKGAAGAQTRRSLGHHLLRLLILRLQVLCAPAVLRPRALQDAPSLADPNS